ncbi:3-phosphoshikimate 1-carboxyvinyltransferase [Mammaliicoccus stepanovicii]|uniref:3-phosphoshikimate 1-carboxyvinyltransferase n=1 Tax=Mammaliicoccus stepanovicii TaxID=643214 RepID=A0A239ZXX7_9STAP|nr:3-phosphoshikimate 1-carboxyvinyltransferase [Mammaliicoccus stepanovicii]PNZ79290.1 3-phosphoshikimate 1-carboxyvinyltransferase [Mammaliicoccus stepanovicii]GGI39171.1 3-phosphoshikimate 1-carboxyvinyltransferase [Mammaliicoccus stepanovicii]SNV75603.1 3-phosphoshikimate 1-carboxyvinyltransferase [Mammaliicoccus stepanovicii]
MTINLKSAKSPWSALDGVEKLTLHPVKQSFNKEVVIPGSKSVTNRAFILAAFSEGTSTLSGYLKSDDTYWCMETLKKLGATFEFNDTDIKVTGIEVNQLPSKQQVFIGSAGTTARFLPGILGTQDNSEIIMTSTEQLAVRPHKTLHDALTQLGVEVNYLEEHGQLPISIKGNTETGGKVSVAGNQSSQFISGLLMAAPLFNKPTEIELTTDIVQSAYVDITIDMMNQFGINVDVSSDYKQMKVEQGKYQAVNLPLEADLSTACYFMALAALTESTIKINHLNLNSHQPDLEVVDILEKMGAEVERGADYVVISGPKQLRGNLTIDMNACSDQALTIGTLATFADGPITITGVEHIRHHECNRVSALTESLSKLGIQIEEHQDGWTITPGKIKSGVLDTFDDHRIAMSLSLIGTKVDGITLLDPSCVSKTCPTYFEMLQSLGITIDYI